MENKKTEMSHSRNENIVFVCAKEKVAFTPTGGAVSMYYGGRYDEKTKKETSGDEITTGRDGFESEMALGKDGLTGNPVSGMFNHFRLETAPDSIWKRYDDFMARPITIGEIAKLAPKNIRYMAEQRRIDGYDTKPTEELVIDIANNMGLDLTTGTEVEPEKTSNGADNRDMLDTMSDKEIRAHAKGKGMRNWHNKKIDTIKDELRG